MSYIANSLVNYSQRYPLFPVLPLARIEKHWPLGVMMEASSYRIWNRKGGFRKLVSELAATSPKPNSCNPSPLKLTALPDPNGPREN